MSLQPEVEVLRTYNPEAAKELRELMFNDKPEKRAKWFKLMEDDVFRHKFNLTLDQQRDLAYAQIKRVCDEGLVSIFDFDNDPKNIFTAHEMLGMVNGSLATKFTVQFNLAGGSLMALHTERHLPFMKKCDSLEEMGCFCFTELGYGNNAPKMETTAIYNEEKQTFTINCPSTKSQKFWITNGACHATFAIVFAQTWVKGVNEGINSFIVPIRDQNLKALPGVYIEDMGMKLGLNGIDNGRLIFTNVVVPREAMLNKFNDVTPEGKFVSETKKVTQRFFKVADRLLSGRLCISAMTLAATKAVLMTTIRYSQQRLAVGPNGKSNTPIMAFQLQQNAILPFLARTLCINFGFNAAKDLFADPTGRENTQIRTFCAIKCLASWNLEKTTTICRERCGGGSYLSGSIIPEGIMGSHSGMTAEGDNRVLMQKVVKDIMTDMVKEIHDVPTMTQCPKRQIPAMKSIANQETLTNLIYYKEILEMKKMKDLVSHKMFEEGKTYFDIWQYEVSDEIQSLAQAFGERFILQNSLLNLAKIKNPGAKKAIEQAIFLHSLNVVRLNVAYYLTNGVISAEAAEELDAVNDAAVKAFVPYMNDCVEALGVPHITHLHSVISRDYEAFNAQDDFENFDAAGEMFDFKKTGAPHTSAKL